MTIPDRDPIRILVKPAKRMFGGRQQWKFEIRGPNGERIDPRDTYGNRNEASAPLEELVNGSRPVELVTYDKAGNVETRIMLRG